MTFSYNSILFYLGFVPMIMILYSIFPRKYRWITLLFANYAFFFVWSKKLIVYNLVTTWITYLFGKKLSSMKKVPVNVDRKKFKKQKKTILAISVLINLVVLIVLKYTNFLGSTIFGSSFTALSIVAPIGISYYTLQNISYLVDVSNKKIEPAHSFFDLSLYNSFFLTIMEGPITRFSDMIDQLKSGNPITPENFTFGVERITWGLFQKMIIADHLSGVVNTLFANYKTSGALSLLAAVLCTIQLYMDFKGTIDIALGVGKLFGITIAENFRQPFFAKNAGDFWRRWHITLGAFLRDYVFYPVSLSKPIQKLTKWCKKHLGNMAARYVGPLIALFCVWICNGFWHGPYWTYVFYGMYYFVLMVLELFLEKPFEKWCMEHHLDVNGWGIRTFRFIKLFIIVIIGEMFFRAPTFTDGWTMLVSMFTNFHMSELIQVFPTLGLTNREWIFVIVSFGVVIVVSVLKEKNISIHVLLDQCPSTVRWGVLYALIFAVILFGAYGPGYDEVAMMYAGF